MEKGFRNALLGFKKRDVLCFLQKAEQEHSEGLGDILHQLESLKMQNSDLLAEKDDAQKRIDELASDRAALIAQKDEQICLCKQARETAEELEKANADLKAELDALKKQNADLSAKLAEGELCKAENQSLRIKADELLKRAENAETELKIQVRNRRKEMVLGEKIKNDPIRAILAYVRKK